MARFEDENWTGIMGSKGENDDEEEAQLKAQLKKRLTSLDKRKLDIEEAHRRPEEAGFTVRGEILGARNVDNKDFGGKSDPFCVVVLGKDKYKTQIVWDNLNPEWEDERFNFHWKPHIPPAPRDLELRLYDHDTIAPDPLGSFSLPLNKVQMGVKETRWEKLKDSKRGEIGFSIEVLPYQEPKDDEEEEEEEDPTPASPQSLYVVPDRPRSLEYQVMQIPPEDIPPDPRSVLEPNSKFCTPGEVARREEKISNIFGDWDMDGSGRIELDEIQQVLVSFRGAQSEKQERILKRWGTLVASRYIRDKGYGRDELVPFIVQLTNEYTQAEFQGFLDHILSTIQVMLEITEQGRRTKATWRLFKAWDTNQNLTLDTNQLEHIIQATEYGQSHMELLTPLLEDIRKKKPECQGVDDVTIKDFHIFMEKLLDGLSEMEMNFVYGQIRTAMSEELLEDNHIVSKFMNANKKLYGGDRPAEGQVTEDDKLTAQLMWQLQSEARHAFDSLTLEDIEQALNDRTPGDVHRIIATPVCLVFGIKPAQNIKTSKLCYWEGLKNFLVDEPYRFLHFLQNFELSHLPYDLVRKIMVFHFKEESDPHFLMFHSKFLSCLCVWCEAAVRLACMIRGWQYPPPPLEDQELVEPTFQGTGIPDAAGRVHGFLREQPPLISLGSEKPPKKINYVLPHWGEVKNWSGGRGSDQQVYDAATGKLKEGKAAGTMHGIATPGSRGGYKLGAGGPPVQARNANGPARPTTTVPESGALDRLTALLIAREKPQNYEDDLLTIT